jgi:uncharacterized protein (DUF736 family)
VKEYDNNNRGVLFKNDKDGNEKRPDYRGSATINGVDLNISAWIKRSQKTGDAYMSLSFEPKKAAAPKRAPVMDETPFKDDADLPF